MPDEIPAGAKAPEVAEPKPEPKPAAKKSAAPPPKAKSPPASPPPAPEPESLVAKTRREIDAFFGI